MWRHKEGCRAAGPGCCSTSLAYSVALSLGLGSWYNFIVPDGRMRSKQSTFAFV
ncbi:hypothetical protein K443DRAFT_686875 [Laccaria amethystina LaAM-08-1]|uniref:Uncharacterized protein n=1 Tax=Laccaria amethystina LaAM-08-1 TaxID=1095629 RepID=A0A0C9WGY3_9AGAR|nr:hypothetical protein K443DRAFT_686875 [Laccaria amethystina LaAM-08-1]